MDTLIGPHRVHPRTPHEVRPPRWLRRCFRIDGRPRRGMLARNSVAIVQELHGSTTSASTITVTLPSSFTLGNLILAWEGSDSGALTAPTVNGVNMTQVTNGVATTIGGARGSWYYRVAQSGDGAAVVGAWSGSSGGLEVYELAGADIPIGVASQTSGTGFALATQSIISSANGIVFAGFFQNGLPGASRAYTSSVFPDDIGTNIRLQCAHLAGTGGALGTTLTTTNSNSKTSAIIDVPAAITARPLVADGAAQRASRW